MTAAQKISFVSIWSRPREAIRYYSARQSTKLKQLIIVLTSLELTVLTMLQSDISNALNASSKISSATFIGFFIGALIGNYIFCWIMSYVCPWFYTLAARWLKGQGRFRDNRLVFLLTWIADIPLTLLIMLMYGCLAAESTSMSAIQYTSILISPIFAFSIYLITVQLRYASELNCFSKTRAFFAGIIAMLIALISFSVLSAFLTSLKWLFKIAV